VTTKKLRGKMNIPYSVGFLHQTLNNSLFCVLTLIHSRPNRIKFYLSSYPSVVIDCEPLFCAASLSVANMGKAMTLEGGGDIDNGVVCRCR
jgi:hypothetical protein